MKDLKGLLTQSSTSGFWRMIGGQNLINLAITSNYSSFPHDDDEDLGFAFLFWFVKGNIFKTHFLFVFIVSLTFKLMN